MISNQGVQPKPAINSNKKLHVSELLNYEPEANGLLEKWDSLDESLNADSLVVVQNESKVDLPTHIMGTPELQSDIKDLLVEFSDIFRKDVSPKPTEESLIPNFDHNFKFLIYFHYQFIYIELGLNSQNKLQSFELSCNVTTG